MWAGAGLVVLVGMVAPAAPAAPSACDGFEPVEVGGTVAEPRLVELSGLAASPGHADVLWAHNDSGGAAELYAFAEDGTSLGAHPVESADAVDWEDMAAGPAPNGTDAVLYIGDIGDNDASRPTVTVYRVHEPEETPLAPGAPLTEVEAIELRYPDGPSDAEALLIDPRTGDLVIVTKSLLGMSRVLTTPAASLVPGAPVAMIDAGGLRVPLPPDPAPGFPGTAITGGDVSPDGSIVLLRTYRSVLAFPRAADQTLAEALQGEPCFAPQAEEQQGEAVAFTNDGSAFVTISEGANPAINRIGSSQPAATTTTAAPMTTAREDSVPDDDPSTGAVLVAAVVVLVVLGGGALLWSHRRARSGAG